VQGGKTMNWINNLDLEGLNERIEHSQNICEERWVIIINKGKETKDKSIQSKTVKKKKLHMFIIKNEDKIWCDYKKPMELDSLIITDSIPALLTIRLDIKYHFNTKAVWATLRQEKLQEI
jgi:hypothetical protein